MNIPTTLEIDSNRNRNKHNEHIKKRTFKVTGSNNIPIKGHKLPEDPSPIDKYAEKTLKINAKNYCRVESNESRLV